MATPPTKLSFKLQAPRCEPTGERCGKLGTPGDMECLICVLGKIRAELAMINENLEEARRT